MMLSVKSQLTLVSQSSSEYSIVLADQATEQERKAASVLQRYIFEISGFEMQVLADTEKPTDKEICIGRTNRGWGNEKLNQDGFMIKTRGTKLFIYGSAGKSTLYGVYHFLENYLGCRKFTAELKYIPSQKTITLAQISDLQNPALSFRNVYYPDQYDEEFRDWHKLHTLEDTFGLWGHSYDKLVPASTYFKGNPEYYALVNGERTDTQLCLSNPLVFDILTRNLGKMILDEPEKTVWSVSQNDGFGYCTCGSCKAVDQNYGGPQGSVINFANKVAAKFPGKTISTLAYLYSARPPVNLKPVENVSVMLSTINVDRGRPVQSNPRAASFRNGLKEWSAITPNLMIWDYVVQFTNYLSPFPNINYLQNNMNYFGKNKIRGIFIQGTEGSRGEFSALKTYLLAKSAWEPDAELNVHFEEFINAYYGNAGSYIKRYLDELSKELAKTNRVLDIYGGPVIEWNSWLSPEHMEKYSGILDSATTEAEKVPLFAKNVEAERLAVEYAVLQQARFYGLEKHGLFTLAGDSWSVSPGWKSKVERFLSAAGRAGVKVISEGGHSLDTYAKEWDGIFRQGPIIHRAIGSDIRAVIPFSEEYPGKGIRTLVDGSRGYNNFQYNYLGWYGTDMEVIVDLGSIQEISSLSAGFLEDQRHWSFLPLLLTAEVSIDNLTYFQVGSYKPADVYENYETETHRFTLDFGEKQKARYVKLKASNLKELPAWRNLPHRKSWLFCDEIAVFN